MTFLVSSSCHNVKEPVSSLSVADAATTNQLLSGFWWVESNSWRWTAGEFAVALQPPAGSEETGAILRVRLFVPDSQIELLGPLTLSAAAGKEPLAPQTFSKGGTYIFTREIPQSLLATSILPIRFCFDKALPPEKSDGRELGAIVSQIELETMERRH